MYSAPAGTLATTQTTIESSKYNAFVNDLVSDANTARPITAGGTGATTAVGAIDALRTRGTAIASATTTNIADATGDFVHITGTTTIAAFDTADAGVERKLVFDGALTLTHNATSLILPGGVNITTAAGDTAAFASEGSGNWRLLWYQQAAIAAAKRVPVFRSYSSSTTWTKPAGLAYIVVEAWGGGGGGGDNTSPGGTGGSSSFGDHILAAGGSGGQADATGGAGGSAADGDFNLVGGQGGNIDSTGFGGVGGDSPRGGLGSQTGTGGNPGGGGGSSTATSGLGGGGGYSKRTIAAASLSATETVTVGAAGTAGGAGAFAGGAGFIILTEYYS